MSANTNTKISVGLLGINGNLGSHLFQHLLKADQSGDLSLVVLHRPSSNLSEVPEGIEKRVLDLENGSKADLQKAIKGLQVVISNVASIAVGQQIQLVDALQGSSDLITFIPSEFGAPWTKEDFADPRLGFLDGKNRIVERAAELGVPYTIVKTGTFDKFVFEYGAAGIDIKNNKLTWYEGAEHQKTYISSLEFIAAALIDQLVNNPKTLPGTILSLYNYSPTGQEIRSILEKIHGTSTEIVPFTESDYQAGLDKGPGEAIGAALIKKGGVGQKFEGKIVESVKGYNQVSLEEYIRKYL